MGPGADLVLYGEPDLSVVCFGPSKATSISIYAVADELTAKGWNLNILQYPACVHIAVTYANCGRADELLDDIRAALAKVKAAPAGTYSKGSAAMYGMAATIPDKSLVGDVSKSFLDALYLTAKPAHLVEKQARAAAAATGGAGTH